MLTLQDEILFNGYRKTFEDKRKEMAICGLDELTFTEMTYENILKAKPKDKKEEPWQTEFINYIVMEIKRLTDEENIKTTC